MNTLPPAEVEQWPCVHEHELPPSRSWMVCALVAGAVFALAYWIGGAK